MSTDVEAVLRTVEATSDPTRFKLVPLSANAHLSRTCEGAPCIVFRFADQSAGPALTGKALRLDVHPRAQIVTDGESAEHSIAVLACIEQALVREFCVLAHDVETRLSKDRSTFSSVHAVREFYLRWSELLRAARAASPQEALGLWGELHILSAMPNADAAVGCWYGPHAGAHDFGANGVALEVKTSLRGHVHTFGLDQLAESPRTQLLVASLHAAKDPAGGTTVGDLLHGLETRLASPMVFRRKFLELGYDREAFGNDRFVARALCYHRGAAIPRPRDIEAGVSHVRFDADLTGCAAMSTAAAELAIARMLAISPSPATPVAIPRRVTSRARSRVRR